MASNASTNNTSKTIPKTTFVPLWENVNAVPLLTGIKIAPGTAEHYQYTTAPTSLHSQDHCATGLPLFLPSKPSSLGETKCPYCLVKFDCREDQVAHYHLDYHKSNLKRSLAGKPPITEDQFLNEISDVSSISGSESDEDDDDDEDNNDKILRKQSKIFFLNTDGEVISMYRSILESKKCEISGEGEMIQRALLASRRLYWVIVLMGGGHFAAAVFKGAEVVIHKTFHSYTVRSKQGGGQSSRDNRSATSHPRSAGASLRRYNEQSHAQHIQELLEGWQAHFQNCNLILLRVPGRSKNIIFGSRNPILSSSDPRIRTVPFSTRRPTFSEVKRVHSLLTQIEVHGTEDIFIERIKEKEFIENNLKKESTPPRKTQNKNKRNSKRKSSKSEESANDTAGLHIPESSDDDDDELSELMNEQLIIDMSHLKEFGSSIEDQNDWKQRKRKTPRKRKKSGSSGSNNKNEDTNEVNLLVYTSCKIGDVSVMKNIIHAQDQLKTGDRNNIDLPVKVVDALESVISSFNLFEVIFGCQNKGVLHIAAENGQKNLLWWLLEQGCDPTICDKQKQVPYNLCSDKDTRNTFRRFMAKYPDKFDYKKANVPSPLTTADEEAQAEKRRNQRKLKQDREKEKKKQNQENRKKEEERQKEEMEKKRYLSLSDREKRALAAEKRLLQQHTSTSKTPVLLRCFQCGLDISGKVPFEYNNYQFCTTKCVREHRSKKS